MRPIRIPPVALTGYGLGLGTGALILEPFLVLWFVLVFLIGAAYGWVRREALGPDRPILEIVRGRQ